MISPRMSCEEDTLQFLSSPLTFCASDAVSTHYRSSLSSVHSLGDVDPMNQLETLHFGHNDSKAALSFFVPSQVHKSVVSKQSAISFHDQPLSVHFTLNTAFPKSKSPGNHQFPSMETPIDIFTTKDPFVETQSDAQNSEVQAPGTVAFCHSLNSYVVHMACHRVMEVLSCILRTFVGDLDFTTDAARCRIDGVAFISHHAVHFMLYVHEGIMEEDEGMADTPRSTVEYRRSSGDSMSSATFWSYIQHQMQLQCGGTCNGATNPVDVDLDTYIGGMRVFDFVPDDLPEIASDGSSDDGSEHDHKAYLDEITQSIQQNDQLMVDELRSLYQTMTQKGSDTLCRDILCHKAFLVVLAGEALLHRDVSVSRLAILILQQISRNGHRQLMEGALSLFGNINKLLCCHRLTLVKRHAIRLLNGLTDAPSWNIDDIDKMQLLWRIKEYVKENDGDDEMRTLIERINGKLSGN